MKKKYKVVLTDIPYPNLRYEEEHLSHIADLQRYNILSEEDIIINCKDADALLIRYSPITKKVIENLKKCKVISAYAIGVDTVDVPAATDAGIIVTNVPGYCTEEVCDHAMALLLAAARKIRIYNQSIVEDNQWDWQIAKPIYRLRGKTLGLLGYGRISRAMTTRALSFGLRVLVCDPYVSQADCDKDGVGKVGLNEMLQQSDFISIHTPLTSETKGLINLDRLRLMKPNAVIINVSRGQIIEEKALMTALREELIAGAALDVLEIEPPANDNPLTNMKNVILTPHAGFYSEEAFEELRTTAAMEVKRVLLGQRPHHIINPDILKNGKTR